MIITYSILILIVFMSSVKNYKDYIFDAVVYGVLRSTGWNTTEKSSEMGKKPGDMSKAAAL